MSIGRRRFLQDSAKISSLALFTTGLVDPLRLLAEGQGPQVDQKLFPGEKEVWDGVVFMNGLGTRYTGSPAHEKYMAFLDEKLAALGLQVQKIPHTALVRWDVGKHGVKIAAGAGAGREVPISSFCTYSATTGPEGVTGDLVYCGSIGSPTTALNQTGAGRGGTSLALQADMKGKIALVEVAAQPVPFGEWFRGHVREVYNSEGVAELPELENTAAFAGFGMPRSLASDLLKAGALGIIYAWTNLSDDNAAGQTKMGAWGPLPALWVGLKTGKELRQLAQSGGRVTLALEAETTPDVPTHTILATLPGMSSDEIILLWTHTDGNNAIEENGGIAMLNLMKYFSRLSKTSRNRTIVCVISEGHYAEQYVPTSAWVKERPDLIEKAVALVSIEHLGCREWVDDPVANTYKGSGRPETGWAFCPTTPMPDVMVDSLKGTNAGKIAVMDSDVHSFSPGMAAYRAAKVPTIAYICTPPYLLAEGPNGHIQKLDSRQYHEQVRAFGNVIHRLDKMPKSSLKS
jgi:hypothetical protein